MRAFARRKGRGTNLAGGTWLDLQRGSDLGSGEGKLVPASGRSADGLGAAQTRWVLPRPTGALPLDPTGDCHPQTPFTMLRIVALCGALFKSKFPATARLR